MGQVRFGDGIESIRGTFGGVYFGDDNAGTHIRALPRTTARTASPAQRLQRIWYTEKKYAEKFGYPDEAPPIDDIPPGTHCVYSCETLWAHRQPSFVEPTVIYANYFDEWPQHIKHWVNEEYKPGYLEWGLTKQLMWYLTVRFWYIWHYTRGLMPVAAFEAAKAQMLVWISTSAAAVAVPILTLWVGLIAIAGVFAFLAWLEGRTVHLNFNPGRVVIRKGGTLWWGGLIGRPSHKMYDFAICQLSAFEGLIHKQTAETGQYHLNWFYFNGLWQTASLKLLFWYVYTYDLLKCWFRGNAYKIGPNVIRMQVAESQHTYWNVPIGWERAAPGACHYLTQFDDHWGWGGDPKPPL